MTFTASADGRGYLTAEYADRYYFGDAASPSVVLLGTDEFGCLWWTPEPEGWHGASAVTPIDPRSYGDGGYSGPTTFEARALGFGAEETGLCIAPDRAAARAAERRLRASCSSRTEVVYTQDEDGDAWSMRLNATGAPKIRYLEPHVFEFAFAMVAADPFQYVAAELAQERLTYLPVTLGGRKWPKRWPVKYGGGGADYGTLQIVNNGDEQSPTLLVLKGPVTQPTVQLGALSFYITGTLGALDRLVVDSRSGAVTLNGALVYDRFVGDFLYAPPGMSTLTWSGPFADGRLTLPLPDDRSSLATLSAYVGSTRR